MRAQFPGIRYAVLALCLLGFFGSSAYFTYLSKTAPTELNAALGLVHPLNNHGDVVYVSFADAVVARGGLWLVPLALAMIISLRVSPPKSSREAFWKIVLPVIALGGVVLTTAYAWL
jgi:hypothetical protein